jgi:arylsulfatase A-like enzyme/tetratricopeptide (TPR) repeat protein
MLSGSLVLLIIGVVGGYVLSSHRPDRLPSIVPRGLNLLLISIDTLRADHVPAYGYKAVKTPTLDRLAREGAVFRNAFTPVPLTLPSHCSLLTGLLPLSHGVRDNGGFYLSSSQQTLASVLAGHKYRTAGFVSSFLLDSRWGIAKGFEHYFDAFQPTLDDLAAMARLQRPAGETWSKARDWLDAMSGTSFFLWLHFFDPHAPYDPPEPFKTRYALNLYDGEIAYVDAVLGEVVQELERRSLLEKTLIVVVSDHGEGLGDHGESEHALLTYDSTLRVVWIMRLPGGAAAGMSIDRPVSLVDVFPTVLDLLGFRIPGPPVDGTSQVDLLRRRTATGGDVLYAESLYPRLHFGWSELMSIRTDRFKYIRAPRSELYDYRHDPGESDNVIGRYPEVAHRLDQILTAMSQKATGRADLPGSAIDSASERALRSLGYIAGGDVRLSGSSQRLADPKDKAEAYRRFLGAQELLGIGQFDKGVRLLVKLVEDEPEMEPAHRMLREYWIARGEFRTAASTFLEESRRRPSEIDWLMDLGATYKAWTKPTEALRTFKKVIAMKGNHVGALMEIGEILLNQKAYREAHDYFTRALKLSPSSDVLAVRLAETYLGMDCLAEAEKVLNRVLTQQPHASNAHYLLAQLGQRRGDAPRAEREYRLEIATSPWDFRARFNLALLLGSRGDYREQVELLESIPRVAPQFADVYFYLAKALLDLGDASRTEEAMAAARRGLQLAPESPNAPLGHYVLADILGLQGRLADSQREREAGRELERRLAQEQR